MKSSGFSYTMHTWSFRRSPNTVIPGSPICRNDLPLNAMKLSESSPQRNAMTRSEPLPLAFGNEPSREKSRTVFIDSPMRVIIHPIAVSFGWQVSVKSQTGRLIGEYGNCDGKFSRSEYSFSTICIALEKSSPSAISYFRAKSEAEPKESGFLIAHSLRAVFTVSSPPSGNR